MSGAENGWYRDEYKKARSIDDLSTTSSSAANSPFVQKRPGRRHHYASHEVMASDTGGVQVRLPSITYIRGDPRGDPRMEAGTSRTLPRSTKVLITQEAPPADPATLPRSHRTPEEPIYANLSRQGRPPPPAKPPRKASPGPQGAPVAVRSGSHPRRVDDPRHYHGELRHRSGSHPVILDPSRDPREGDRRREEHPRPRAESEDSRRQGERREERSRRRAESEDSERREDRHHRDERRRDGERHPAREYRDPRDLRDPRDPRDHRDPREPRDPRYHRDGRPRRGSLDSGQPVGVSSACDTDHDAEPTFFKRLAARAKRRSREEAPQDGAQRGNSVVLLNSSPPPGSTGSTGSRRRSPGPGPGGGRGRVRSPPPRPRMPLDALRRPVTRVSSLGRYDTRHVAPRPPVDEYAIHRKAVQEAIRIAPQQVPQMRRDSVEYIEIPRHFNERAIDVEGVPEPRPIRQTPPELPAKERRREKRIDVQMESSASRGKRGGSEERAMGGNEKHRFLPHDFCSLPRPGKLKDLRKKNTTVVNMNADFATLPRRPQTSKVTLNSSPTQAAPDPWRATSEPPWEASVRKPVTAAPPSQSSPREPNQSPNDTVSDIVLDQGKIQPEGDDYKLVFISSDSSKESEFNSSSEVDSPRAPGGKQTAAPSSGFESESGQGFIEENDWDYYERGTKKNSKHAKAKLQGDHLIKLKSRKPAPKPAPKPATKPVSKLDSNKQSQKSFPPVAGNANKILFIFDDADGAPTAESTPKVVQKTAADSADEPPTLRSLDFSDDAALSNMMHQTERLQAEAEALQSAIMSSMERPGGASLGQVLADLESQAGVQGHDPLLERYRNLMLSEIRHHRRGRRLSAGDAAELAADGQRIVYGDDCVKVIIAGDEGDVPPPPSAPTQAVPSYATLPRPVHRSVTRISPAVTRSKSFTAPRAEAPPRRKPQRHASLHERPRRTERSERTEPPQARSVGDGQAPPSPTLPPVAPPRRGPVEMRTDPSGASSSDDEERARNRKARALQNLQQQPSQKQQEVVPEIAGDSLQYRAQQVTSGDVLQYFERLKQYKRTGRRASADTILKTEPSTGSQEPSEELEPPIQKPTVDSDPEEVRYMQPEKSSEQDCISLSNLTEVPVDSDIEVEEENSAVDRLSSAGVTRSASEDTVTNDIESCAIETKVDSDSEMPEGESNHPSAEKKHSGSDSGRARISAESESSRSAKLSTVAAGLTAAGMKTLPQPVAKSQPRASPEKQVKGPPIKPAPMADKQGETRRPSGDSSTGSGHQVSAADPSKADCAGPPPAAAKTGPVPGPATPESAARSRETGKNPDNGPSASAGRMGGEAAAKTARPVVKELGTSSGGSTTKPPARERPAVPAKPTGIRPPRRGAGSGATATDHQRPDSTPGAETAQSILSGAAVAAATAGDVKPRESGGQPAAPSPAADGGKNSPDAKASGDAGPPGVSGGEPAPAAPRRAAAAASQREAASGKGAAGVNGAAASEQRGAAESETRPVPNETRAVSGADATARKVSDEARGFVSVISVAGGQQPVTVARVSSETGGGIEPSEPPEPPDIPAPTVPPEKPTSPPSDEVEVVTDEKTNSVLVAHQDGDADGMTTKPLNELRSLIERSREQQQQQQGRNDFVKPTAEREFSPDPSTKLADYFAGLEAPPPTRRSAPRRTPEVRRHLRRSPDADGASPSSTPSHEDDDGGSEPPGSLETLRSDGVASEASDDFDDGFDFGGEGVEALRARLRRDDGDDDFHDDDDEFHDENDFHDEDDHFDSDERYSNGSFSDGSGDEYVEEDFRYARPLDFTLTTIIEESCEDSDSDRSSNKSATPTANPSNFEKYFLFDLGNGPHDPKKYANEESEYSDTFSETNDSIYSEFVEADDPDIDPVEQASSRYFTKGFLGLIRQPSIRSAADDSENQSDGSGSVGSDSEGAPSPEQRRKKVPRSRARIQSDVGGSGGEVSAREASEQSGDTTSGEDAAADALDESISEKVEGQDTMKRKKKRKLMVTGEQSDREIGEKAPRQLEDVFASPVAKASSEPPQLMPLNSVVSNFIQISKTGEAHQSRDSGFLGSSDDLLKESVIREAEERSEGGGVRGSSDSSLSDNDAGSKTPALSGGGPQRTPDSSEETAKKSITLTTKTLTSKTAGAARSPPNGMKNRNKVSRKDSFNNWSSDEETNILMSRLRHFFRTTISNAQRADPNTPQTKPSPFALFESELTRLMKTVPGINDAQVREIVEYLSSEDTWSDSYDSSDYTSSDLEGAYGVLNPAQPDIMTQIQQQISHSCQQIIQRYDPADTSGAAATGGQGGPATAGGDPAAQDSLAAYEKLMGSLKGLSETPAEPPPASPPMLAKVMHHIGSRLVALMQEVSSGAETGSLSDHSPSAKNPRPPSTARLLSKTAIGSPQKPSRKTALAGGDVAAAMSAREAADLNKLLRESKRRKKKEFDSCQNLMDSGAAEGGADDKWARLSGRVRSEGDVSVRSSGSGSTLTIGQPGSECSSSEQVDSDSTLRAADGGDRPRGPRALPRSLSSRSVDGEGQRSTLPRSATAAPPDNPTGSLSLPRRATAAPLLGVSSLAEAGRSARYRPPGYRPTTRRATSARMSPRLSPAGADERMPGSPQPSPSPLVSRSPSVQQQRLSVTSLPASEPDEDTDRTAASSQQGTPTLGSRSGSLLSVCSASEARYGTVTVRGDLQLAVRYLSEEGALELTVHQCRNLAAADSRRNKSDPYVKVYLLPDRSKSGKRKTKTKKHTLNPMFEEVLKFPAALSELGSRTLWVTVWHSDMFGRNDFLGEVLLPLGSLTLDDSTATARWHPLQERSDLHEEGGSGRGDVVVALKYAPPEEGLGSRRSRRSRGALHVMVKEAKYLVAVRSNGSADPFCKCYLLPDRKGSKQKTSVVRRTTSPRWTGTLLFSDVTLAELKERALELTIWDHSLTSSELLGGARFNNGSGQHQGQPAHWMDAEGTEASLWDQMLDRPGFWVEGSVPLRATLESGSAAIK